MDGVLEFKKASIVLFSILLIIIVVLLVLSNSVNITRIASYNVEINAKPGWNIMHVNWLGTVEMSGEVPRNVTVYPLRKIDYIFYNRTNAIPTVKQLNHNTHKIMVENIEYLIVFNNNPVDKRFKIFVNLYSVTRPYAYLSLIAYVLTVVFIALVFVRISKTISQK